MLKRAPLAAFAFALLLAPGLVEATTISAPDVTLDIGDTVLIQVSITDAVDLEFFQFDFLFDPLILQADGAGPTAGGLLPADWLLIPGFVDNTGGQILGTAAFGSAFSGSGVIAVIQFTAIASGASPLTFANSFLNLSDQGFDTAPGQAAAVPEPTTLGLLAGGLALARRRLAKRRLDALGPSGSTYLHRT